MWSFLGLINKNLVIAIPVVMVFGFLYGIAFPAGFLKSLIIPFTFLMVYPMMVTLKIKKVFEGGDLKAQVITQIINFGIVPFVSFGLGILFFKDQPYMALGLLLAGLVPTSGMTISWTGFAKGNVEAAVKMTVIGLTIGSIATPFYVKFLMGAELDVDIAAVMKQIVIIVFIPMAAGYFTQQQLIKKFGMKEFQQRWAPRFPGLSTIGVIGIVFIAIALKAKAVFGSPNILFLILIPLSIIYVFNYILSTFIGKIFLPRGDAIALVYGSVMRNLSIALAIAINTFGPKGSDTALVIAIAYIIQVQSAAWYVKFTDKIYGSAEIKPKPAVPEPEAAGDTIVEKTMVPEIRRILFATDMSQTAGHAVRYACSIGHKYNAEVTVLHVIPDILEEFSSGAGIDLVEHLGEKKWKEFNKNGIDKARETIRKRIAETSRRVLEEIPRCPVAEGSILVEVGNPVNRIVSIAESGNYDLVIMGTHGHGKLEEFMIGSVLAGVIKRCSVPVLTAPLPKQ
ncbi:Bile acid:sodium symporter family protein [Desulfonema limicola]|uniref:Bile acid:sodium symporter family protein n=1 Tax=Desulfonema limicola TaxID=45656 RepID=A0A975B5W5_9BACT|nr:universal stress protein [Desulfonema limicola]QTA79355.1 Bile acid:sodium symporter family protein [Desulfonema limicola]